MPVNIHNVQSMVVKTAIPNAWIFTARISTLDIWKLEHPVEISNMKPVYMAYGSHVDIDSITKIRYPAVINLVQTQEYLS